MASTQFTRSLLGTLMALHQVLHNTRFRTQEFISSNRSIIYALVGVLLSMGPAIVWKIIVYFKQPIALEVSYQDYAQVITMLAFASFGFIVGRFHDQVQELADSDILTGLLNQVSFYKIVDYLYPLAMRKQETVAIIMLDIDHFKNVNDSNNHLVGSFILKEIATILKSVTRSSDAVARFGGDEFIIFLSNLNGGSYKFIPERIREKIAESTFSAYNYKLAVTASLGVAVTPAKSSFSIKELVATADEALYLAKEKGRNRVEIKVVTPPPPAPYIRKPQ